MAWNNVDMRAAQAASAVMAEAEKIQISKTGAEGLCTGAASILAHQGVTALFLHLQAEGPGQKRATKPEKLQLQQWADAVAAQAYGLLVDAANVDKAGNAAGRQRVDEVAKIGEDLKTLLEAKQSLEQFFIYLRYHVRALLK